MAASNIWGIASIIFGACASGVLSSWIIKIVERRKAAQIILNVDKKSRALLRLKAGIPIFRPLASKLLKLAIIDNACETAVHYLQANDVDTTKEAVLSLVVATGVFILIAVATVSRSIVCGIAIAFVALIGINNYVHSKIEKMNLSMREEIPDAMRAMETCFRSGLSLLQTLEQTSKECPGVLGKLFGIAARRLGMGATPSEALSIMRSNSQVPELAFISVALDVQHQSGGSIAPVLEAARESVASELDLLRSLRVQTAQAKLSAGIVTIMPFILVGLFSLMSPDFLSPFFQSILGMGLLALALIMQLSGVLIVRRMLKIDAG